MIAFCINSVFKSIGPITLCQ